MNIFKRIFGRKDMGEQGDTRETPQQPPSPASHEEAPHTPPVRLRCVSDYLKLVGMRVEFTLRDEEDYEGTVVDLSDTGTHVVTNRSINV
jgi:hypothetical protein